MPTVGGREYAACDIIVSYAMSLIFCGYVLCFKCLFADGECVKYMELKEAPGCCTVTHLFLCTGLNLSRVKLLMGMCHEIYIVVHTHTATSVET